jgi:phospholipase C
MFEPTTSWSLPAHLFMLSAWSATCRANADPESCSSEIETPPYRPDYQEALAPPNQPPPITTPDYTWTDLTYLLHARNVTWAYYIEGGNEPDCADDQMVCPPILQSARTPGIWNPLPWFDTVRDDNQLGNVQDLSNFLAAATNGTLPAVSWIVPNAADSEVPPASIRRGQAHVTTLINTVMQGPDWNSTAIFLAWDDWSGFYDHVVPPVVDDNGYGLRVPGLLISPYARRGLIDHQVLSFDAYLKFIEDRFLGGQRLDPATDSRPDSRPDVREAESQLGDLRSEFDFTQAPLPPLVLPVQ